MLNATVMLLRLRFSKMMTKVYLTVEYHLHFLTPEEILGNEMIEFPSLKTLTECLTGVKHKISEDRNRSSRGKKFGERKLVVGQNTTNPPNHPHLTASCQESQCPPGHRHYFSARPSGYASNSNEESVLSD